jgi:hypothetical protein
MEFLKQHKLAVGGVIAAIFVIVLVFSSSGGSTAATTVAGDSTDSTDQANAFNNIMAQVNGQVQLATIAAGSQDQYTAAQLTAASYASSSTDLANTLAAQVAEFTTSKQADVAIDSNHTQLGIVQSNNTTSSTNMSTLANALIAQSSITANVANTASNNQAATTQAYINSLPGLIATQGQTAVGVAQAQNQQCTSVLFGLFSSC